MGGDEGAGRSGAERWLRCEEERVRFRAGIAGGVAVASGRVRTDMRNASRGEKLVGQ
jgi:hypothetical protein